MYYLMISRKFSSSVVDELGWRVSADVDKMSGLGRHLDRSEVVYPHGKRPLLLHPEFIKSEPRGA